MPSSLLLASLIAAAGLLNGAPGNADPKVTDDRVADEGAAWNGRDAVELRGTWQWDLGKSTELSSAIIQADNNDRYILSVSEDGQNFADAFIGLPVPEPGLRTREMTGEPTHARYVQLRADGGDGRYSVSELQVSGQSGLFGQLSMQASFWLTRHPLAGWWFGALLVTVAALFLRLQDRLAATPARAAVIAATVIAAWQTGTHHDGDNTMNFVRFVVSLMALVAVLFALKDPLGRLNELVTAVLGTTAVVAMLCFFNFGKAQFFDAGRGQPTFLHHYDMRTYFLLAKYFDELRFDGVYAASTAAVAERVGYERLDSMPMRDLRDHVVRPVSQSRAHIDEVRGRFSAARWAEFRTDCDYFSKAMGDGGFLGSMNDHGGNATPVWLVGALALFCHFPASDFALWLGVFGDMVLLALAFGSLWWAYGARTSLVAMTIFGGMDFYMFGTDWFGAGLRHDWMSLWCIGVALLKKNHGYAAGAMLAWSALIRAFPAIAFVTLVAPVLADVVPMLIRTRKLDLKGLIARHRNIIDVVIGAGVATAVLVLLSVAVFGTHAWSDWWIKVNLLDKDGHLNNIAVKTYLVGTQPFVGLIALGSVLAVWAIVGKTRADIAVAAGAALVGIVFSPANYYLHCLFLLAVLASYRDDGTVDLLPWVGALGMCAGCYWAGVPDLAKHFQRETIVMVIGVALCLGAVARTTLRRPKPAGVGSLNPL